MRATMKRRFRKMHGLGNDFAIFDAREAPLEMDAERARALADRRTGIGCDQLIVLEPSDRADLRMRIWNPDGGEVESCGNAARCVAWLMMQASGQDTARIDTLGGLLGDRAAGEGRVTDDMGSPGLEWTDIPLAEEMDTRGIELQVGP